MLWRQVALLQSWTEVNLRVFAQDAQCKIVMQTPLFLKSMSLSSGNDPISLF